MSAELRAALREVASGYPQLPPPQPGLFDRAKRAQTRRRVTATLAVIVALAAIGLLPRLIPDPPQPAQRIDIVRVPTYVVEPPKWTADIRHAPISRALTAFVLSGDKRQLVLVGPEDQYRTYEIPAGGVSSWAPSFLLSPDGRFVMTALNKQTQLLDVGTGDVRTLDGGAPLAWSPDGTQAVLANLDEAELRVVQMPSGEELWSVPLQQATWEISAAFSPDGSALAVQQAGVLSVHRAEGKTWNVSIGSRPQLTGPHAWTADGRKIALANLTKGSLLDLIDSTTGEPAGVVESTGAYLSYVGEQGRTDGLPSVTAWVDGAPIVNIGNKGLFAIGASSGVVMTTADGTHELQVASVAIDWRSSDPGPPNPGPTLQRYRPLITAGLAGLFLVIVIGWVLRRVRASGRSRARSRR